MKELENKLKELEIENISIADLEILQEMEYQAKYYLEIKLDDNDKEMIFKKIHEAWLKSEDLQIYQIVTVALENIKELKNMSTFDLIDKVIWRF